MALRARYRQLSTGRRIELHVINVGRSPGALEHHGVVALTQAATGSGHVPAVAVRVVGGLPHRAVDTQYRYGRREAQVLPADRGPIVAAGRPWLREC